MYATFYFSSLYPHKMYVTLCLNFTIGILRAIGSRVGEILINSVLRDVGLPLVRYDSIMIFSVLKAGEICLHYDI